MFNQFWNDAWAVGLVNHLWQSTLVVLVAWMLALALKRYQARVRYWVWMAASLKFLFPFSLLAALGGLLRSASAPAIEASPLINAVAKAEHPFLSAQGAGTASIWLPEQASAAPVAHHGLTAFEVLAAVWLCGALLLLFRWIRNWREIRKVLREALPGPQFIDVAVMVTQQKIEPGVFGLFHPRLLVSSHLLQGLPDEQIRAILEHERCHVQRRDNLTGALHMLVETVFWFHPAVWWIERRLIEERERACDEAVLQLGSEAEVYAESILNVCKSCVEMPALCMPGVTGSELKQRILRIMTKGPAARLDSGRKVLLAVAVAVLISFPVMTGLLHSSAVRAQSKPASAAQATQKIAATWQGTLRNGRESRFVVKIAAESDGNLRCTFYNLTGEPGGMPGFSTAFDGSSVKIDLGFATYEGALSADGNSLTGRWRQGADSQPLVFVRAIPATEWAIPQPAPPPAPMAADANPELEISTIKPSTPEEHGPRYMFDHRRFSVVHVTLDQLVQFAYRVQAREIESGPEWFRTEAYDITGQPGGEGEPSIQQWRTMVKKLMADRFKLKVHDDKREMSVYALTLAKGGPKFAQSHGDPNGGPGLGFGPGNMGATNATMAEVAEAMQQGAVDRPMVDQTGLKGRFDMAMRWTPSDMPATTQNGEAPPDLFTAVQEQLGLKLVATRAPVGVIVIDRVEKPSAN